MSDSRISPWVVKFNIAILPAIVESGKPYYKVKDIFTTRDGSWENHTIEGGLPVWARETYLKPWGHPEYFDDAGGDRHAFGAIYDEAAKSTIKTAKFRYYNWTDNSSHKVLAVKPKSGWANDLAQNLYFPDMDGNVETGNRGPWAWRPEMGLPAETVIGAGMPFNWHISVFATWTLEQSGVVIPPTNLEQRVEKFEQWAISWSNSYPEGPQYVRS